MWKRINKKTGKGTTTKNLKFLRKLETDLNYAESD